VRRARRGVPLVVGFALLLGACGKKGPPLPPLRHNPQVASAVRVGQQGENLVVSYQVPAMSVDNLRLAGAEVDLLVVEGVGKTARKSPSVRLAATPGQTRIDKLPLPAPGRSVSVTVRVKSQGAWSIPNRPVVFDVQAPPPPASAVTAANDPAGVLISWKTPPPTPPTATPVPTASATPRPTPRARPGAPVAGASGSTFPGEAFGLAAGALAGVLPTPPPKEAGYLVRRRLGDAAAENLTVHPIAAPPYVDEKAQPGSRYCYTVLKVDSMEPLVASAEAPETCLEVKDLRPPAAPSGVALLPQGAGLEVSWSPSPETDILFYRVYRATAGGELQKVVERSGSERSFVDTTAARGTKYRYVVTAVDRADNESAQSTPVEGMVP
jgi:hypothetical protein